MKNFMRKRFKSRSVTFDQVQLEFLKLIKVNVSELIRYLIEEYLEKHHKINFSMFKNDFDNKEK